MYNNYSWPVSASDKHVKSVEVKAQGGGKGKMDTGIRRYDKGTRGVEPHPTGEEKLGTFGPEDVLGYIYGVLHSPVYRERYAEFLKIDFPRVPVPASRDLFVRICGIGHVLMGLHLLESEVLEDMKEAPAFAVEGDNVVEKGYPKYVVKEGGEQEGKVFINGEQSFDGVRRAVWDFYVGGYQVCEKWLKDRRGRALSYEDIEHYQKVVVALGETIGLMGEPCLAEMFNANKK